MRIEFPSEVDFAEKVKGMSTEQIQGLLKQMREERATQNKARTVTRSRRLVSGDKAAPRPSVSMTPVDI